MYKTYNYPLILKMFTYNLLNTANLSLNKNTIDIIFENISNIVKRRQKGTLNIVFLDDDSIKNLNNNYRKINSSTDVLSFHYFDDFTNCEENDIVGEIIMSETLIIKQGKEYLHGSEKEFYKLLIHSILHILGYDHENEKDYEEMNSLEEYIWETIFGKNIKNV